MVKIKKSEIRVNVYGYELYEEYDRKKIEMALVNAGARNPDVKEIPNLVKPYEGMTTNDVDEIVIKELEKRDPTTAKYWKMKRDYFRNRFKNGGN